MNFNNKKDPIIYVGSFVIYFLQIRLIYLGLFYKDVETGWYYLQSRYYNPEIGRFINADGLIGQQGDILGHNMYAYTSNNPIMRIDPTGEAWWLIAIAVVIIIYYIVEATKTNNNLKEKNKCLEDYS